MKPETPPYEDLKLNGYQCRACGFKIVTADIHVGVTPFMLRCMNDKCVGEKAAIPQCMESLMYPPPTHRPEWMREIWESKKNCFEFYRPGVEEVVTKCAGGGLDHVMRGGLLLRRACGSPPLRLSELATVDEEAVVKRDLDYLKGPVRVVIRDGAEKAKRKPKPSFWRKRLKLGGN